MSEHTAEPWHTSQNAARSASLDWVLRPGIGGVVTEADARRIVACVNALAGVPTEDLADFQRGGWLLRSTEKHREQEAEIARLRDQVRRLKEGLTRIRDRAGIDPTNGHGLLLAEDTRNLATALLAELEEEKI